MSVVEFQPKPVCRLTLAELDAVLGVVLIAVQEVPSPPLETGTKKLLGQLIRMQTLQRTRAR